MPRSSFLRTSGNLVLRVEFPHLDFQLLESVLDHVEVVLEPLGEQHETPIQLVFLRLFFLAHRIEHFDENLSRMMKAQNAFPFLNENAHYEAINFLREEIPPPRISARIHRTDK